MKSQIKIVISIFLLSITMHIEAQNLLTRIQASNYFTNGNEVYFVMSNKFNSSGFFSEIINGIDTLQIVTLDDEKPFNHNAIVISKDTFLSKFKLNSQFFKKANVAVPLPNVALAYFNVFGKNYAIYKNNVFHQYNKIENVDAATFKVISEGYNALSKDENAVYFKESIIEGANPKTFQVLQEDYSKDDKAVFKQDKRIKNADPNSFEVLSYTYQKDENHVWIMGKLSSIDIKSFKILNYTYPNINGYKIISLYATDKKKVYFQGEIVPKADPNTFKLLVSGAPYQVYGIDNNAIFYNKEIVKEADSKTFEIIKLKTSAFNYDAQDKNYFYIRDTAIKKL